MKSESFAYWLQGYLELAGTGPMTAKQVKCIADHLALVFLHEIDPSQKKPEPKTEHQQKLDEVHSGHSHPFGPVLRC